jgi:3-methyladenine DNA glycosylase/8-oxoguanine DNA glycosylase
MYYNNSTVDFQVASKADLRAAFRLSYNRHMHALITTPTDFSYHETLTAHGWRQLAPFVWDDAKSILLRTERLDDGSVIQFSVAHRDPEHLTVQADRDVDLTELTQRVVRIFQLDRSLEAFHAYTAEKPELEHIGARKQGRMMCSPTLFEDCVKVLLTTNTTWAQTRGMVSRIVTAYGSRHPDTPNLHAFPTPVQIASVPFDDFAATAKLGYRAAAVHRLACDVAERKTDLEALRDPELTTEEVMNRLLALHGIGPYGAACLLLYLGRGDRVNVDSWARTLVSRELGRKVTDKEVHAFFAPYGEWQGFVYHFYNWKHQSEENAAAKAA